MREHKNFLFFSIVFYYLLDVYYYHLFLLRNFYFDFYIKKQTKNYTPMIEMVEIKIRDVEAEIEV